MNRYPNSFQNPKDKCVTAEYLAIDEITVSVNNTEMVPISGERWKSGYLMGTAVQVDVSVTNMSHIIWQFYKFLEKYDQIFSHPDRIVLLLILSSRIGFWISLWGKRRSRIIMFSQLITIPILLVSFINFI